MPRRAIIDLRAMLREFGYEPERMTPDARTSAATRIIKRHRLDHFAMPGKRGRHCYRDQVVAAAQPIKI